MKIKNINSAYGDTTDVFFEGNDLPECIREMANAIVECGEEISLGQNVNDFCFRLREGVDYEIV